MKKTSIENIMYLVVTVMNLQPGGTLTRRISGSMQREKEKTNEMCWRDELVAIGRRWNFLSAMIIPEIREWS